MSHWFLASFGTFGNVSVYPKRSGALALWSKRWEASIGNDETSGTKRREIGSSVSLQKVEGMLCSRKASMSLEISSLENGEISEGVFPITIAEESGLVLWANGIHFVIQPCFGSKYRNVAPLPWKKRSSVDGARFEGAGAAGLNRASADASAPTEVGGS